MIYEIPKNAKILSIKEDTIIDNSGGWRESYEGLIIETDNGSIKLVISDDEINNETQLRITTDRGIIQYAIYNEHNGYYCHGTILQVFDTIETGSL